MIDERIQDQVAALMEQVARQSRQIARLTAAVNTLSDRQIPVLEGTVKCPQCPNLLVPDAAGLLPPHDFGGARPGSIPRRPVCRHSGRPVESGKAVA